MKQFILEKFYNFNQEIYVEFNAAISKNLPFIGNSDLFDTHAMIWGDLETGFWFVNTTEGRLFENNGIMHCVDFWKNEDQYKIINDLYEINKIDNFCKMAEPLIFEKHVLEIDDHPSGNPRGTEFYYTQFSVPEGMYGIPPNTGSLFEAHTNDESTRLKYFNKISTLMISLNKLGHPLCKKPDIFKHNDDMLFMFNSPFNLSVKEFESYFENQIDTPSMKEYGKTICIQQLT
jgi:hypothetical protein